jgi:hypothetical protein
MIKSKFFSEADLQRLVSDTEAEIMRREERQFEAERLEKVRQWAQDPVNAAQLAQIRTEFDRIAPAQRQPQQRPAARPAAPVQKIGFSNEAKDPYCGSPSPTPKSARYSPGAPALPPGGFWVL